MDALIKEIEQAKKRLPKSSIQLKVLERLLEQSKEESKISTNNQWKKVEGTKVLSKQEQVEEVQSNSLLKLKND